MSLNRMSSPPDSPLAAPLQTVKSFIVGMIWSLVMMMKNIEKCFEDPAIGVVLKVSLPMYIQHR